MHEPRTSGASRNFRLQEGEGTAAKVLERAIKNANDAGLVLFCGAGSVQLRGLNAYSCVRSTVFLVNGAAEGGDGGDEDREFDDLFRRLDLMEQDVVNGN